MKIHKHKELPNWLQGTLMMLGLLFMIWWMVSAIMYNVILYHKIWG